MTKLFIILLQTYFKCNLVLFSDVEKVADSIHNG